MGAKQLVVGVLVLSGVCGALAQSDGDLLGLSEGCIANLPEYEDCHERCEGCVGRANHDCIACKPGYVLDVQFDQCIGRCVNSEFETLYSPYTSRHWCNTYQTESGPWQCAREAMLEHPGYARHVDFAEYDHTIETGDDVAPPAPHEDAWAEDEDEFFEPLFGVNGGKCFKQDMDVQMGICGDVKMKMGVCADTSSEADQSFAAANFMMIFLSTYINEEAKDDCKHINAEICGGFDKVKKHSCDAMCDVMSFQIEYGLLRGCHKDDQCPLTSDPMHDMPPLCCSYMEDVLSKTCKLSKDELMMIMEAAKNPEFDGVEGGCSEAPECIHPGSGGTKKHRGGGGMPTWAKVLLSIFGIGCFAGVIVAAVVVYKRRGGTVTLPSIYARQQDGEGKTAGLVQQPEAPVLDAQP